MSFSIEHLEPKVDGGSNDQHNLTAAHRICNSLRSATPHNQLPGDFLRICRDAVHLSKKGVRIKGSIRKHIYNKER